MSSNGSGLMSDEYRPNDLTDCVNEKEPCSESIYDEEDPDAMDEAVSGQNSSHFRSSDSICSC